MSDKFIAACAVCEESDIAKLKKCPIMTGIPFSAQLEEQVFVCSPCIQAWRDGGGTTPESILARRKEMEAEGYIY